MLKKSIRYMCLSCLISILLTAVFSVCVFYNTDIRNGNAILKIGLPVLLIISGVFLFAVLISALLCDRLSAPLRDIDLNAQTHKGVYPEILPLVERIELQNREISRQIDRVKRQKSRLYVVGESMSEGLIVFDGDGKILTMNTAAEKIFRPRKNAAGNPFSSISQNIEIYEAIERACLGSKAMLTEKIGEKTYQIFISPAINKGLVSSAVMLIFDVSELEKTEKIRREFTANVSHELKTPLTTILGYSQIINNGIAKKDDIFGFTEKIERETTRLISLVDDIMKLSRLDEDSERESFQKISLADIAKEVADRLSPKAEKNGITFSLSCDSSQIIGDSGQISELIYNLYDNGIKYNKPGGKVFVSVSDSVLSVKDTGIGIPEKYFDRIYERFFRVDKSHSKKIGGTGLGLSIVKHIAQRHNAVISLESRENCGTEFKVVFPRTTS